ncbi:uncharacterized protein LOC109593926 [Aethina tumida]|uniref:uncharacterized protein LOC109593926 n=1 Tax=Aethina tumida TaxID=116153 RepID=UPI00096AFECF|nr:uncharacterized protein LOC109593926 [Aethina tumida]XP_049823246.1 uncharacterized protein LOC109593926 [Aethina tumida]
MALKRAVLLSCLSLVFGQIAFPEPDELVTEAENRSRVPLFAPNECKDPNELLYPGNQKNDWICDCLPGYIYYPPKRGCFPAYRKGPCERGQHLILKKEKAVPECTKNPCNDGFARFNGKCFELGKPNGPCLPELHGGGIFGVNGTTLELGCLKNKIHIFFNKMAKRFNLHYHLTNQ